MTRPDCDVSLSVTWTSAASFNLPQHRSIELNRETEQGEYSGVSVSAASVQEENTGSSCSLRPGFLINCPSLLGSRKRKSMLSWMLANHPDALNNFVVSTSL